MSKTTFTVFKGVMLALKVSFKDSAGDPSDPTTVKITIRPSGGEETTFDAGKDGGGHYSYYYTPTVDGLHVFYFTGTDVDHNLIVAAKSEFMVVDL